MMKSTAPGHRERAPRQAAERVSAKRRKQRKTHRQKPPGHRPKNLPEKTSETRLKKASKMMKKQVRKTAIFRKKKITKKPKTGNLPDKH